MEKSPFAVETPEERRSVLPLFRERAIRFALSRRMRINDAEDFASFAMIDYLRSGRYEFAWLWVDYLRETLGRPGTPGFEAKHALATALSLDQVSIQSEPERNPGPSRDAHSLLLFIRDERVQKIFQLYLEGHTMAEIGRIIDAGSSAFHWAKNRHGKLVRRKARLSEARVSQLMGEGYRDIRRRLGLSAQSDNAVSSAPNMLEPTQVPVYQESFKLIERICVCGCGKRWKTRPESPSEYFSESHRPDFNSTSDAKAAKELARKRTDQLRVRIQELTRQGLTPKQMHEIVCKEKRVTSRGKPPSLSSIVVMASKARKQLGLGPARKQKDEEPKPQEIKPEPPSPEIKPKKRRTRVSEIELPKIESGVPVPKNSFFRESPWKGLAEQMQVGDSVQVDKRGMHNICGQLRKLGFRGIARVVEEGKYRVWKAEAKKKPAPEEAAP